MNNTICVSNFQSKLNPAPVSAFSLSIGLIGCFTFALLRARMQEPVRVR